MYDNNYKTLSGGNSCEFPPKTICPSSRDIYRLECPWQTEPYNFDPMECKWIKMEQELIEARYGHSALMIPNAVC